MAGDDDWTPRERALVDYLVSQAHRVRPGELLANGRLHDAFVDEVRTEFKTPGPGATSGTLLNRANESKRGGGQARALIFDVRGTGMARSEAERGCRRIAGAYWNYFDTLRVVGDGYDVTMEVT